MATLNHSIVRSHRFEPLQIEGRLPPELCGTMYRTGPGLLERFGMPVAHPFDADGAVTAVRMAGGMASGACRVVESPEYLEEERAGRFLYSHSASWTRRVRNRLQGREKSTGNTNILSWQGHLLALMEGSRPVELDPEQLDTRTSTNLGVIRGRFSAHPHRVESLKTTFNFGLSGNGIDLYALPDDGPARCIGSFSLPWLSMIHDFIATDRHLIFVIGPAKLVMWRAVLALGDMSKYFKWDPSAGTQVIVVPLAEPERITRFSVDAFWVWHFVNAFEDGEHIAVDLCRHDDFSAFAAPSSAGPEQGQPSLYRYKIHPIRRTMKGDCLWNTPIEFPSVHPLKVGTRQRYTWLQTFPTPDQHPGVARFDCETGRVETWAAPHEHLGSEPMFVARSDREEAGWVLQLFQDPEAKRSYLAVLDAERLSAGTLAKVWFQQPIPMTFHGTFVASAASKPIA